MLRVSASSIGHSSDGIEPADRATPGRPGEETTHDDPAGARPIDAPRPRGAADDRGHRRDPGPRPALVGPGGQPRPPAVASPEIRVASQTGITLRTISTSATTLTTGSSAGRWIALRIHIRIVWVPAPAVKFV